MEEALGGYTTCQRCILQDRRGNPWLAGFHCIDLKLTAHQEYRAIRLIPLDTIIDAVEIDPLSKSKKHCLQLITEEKSYRFAAVDETQLAKCLGALKVTLAKRRKFE